MSGWYRVYSRFYKIARGFYRLQKTSAVFYSCRQTCVQVLCHELPSPFFLYNYTLLQLNQYNRLFLSFCIVIWGTFLSLALHFIFYRESFSFFLSTKLIPWYKSFVWFLCIKALLSPPLLDCQLNLFVKCSLNLDDYLFSRAWKSLSISFTLSPSASTFIFFCVKDSLNKKNSVCCRAPTACFSPALPPDSPIFFLCVKISLCSRFFPVILIVLLSLHRYISSFSSSVFFLFFRENYSYFIFNI